MIGIKDLDKKLAEAKANPSFHCRHHPTDWFHEVGCPCREWSKEEFQDALNSARAMNRVYQHELWGLPLDGKPSVSYEVPPQNAE